MPARWPRGPTVEDLRNFQLHLVDTGISPITLNATITGLKFFFDITLGQIELMAQVQPVKVPRTLPVVLSTQKVTRLIAAARNVKHQAALSVAYCVDTTQAVTTLAPRAPNCNWSRPPHATCAACNGSLSGFESSASMAWFAMRLDSSSMMPAQ